MSRRLSKSVGTTAIAWPEAPTLALAVTSVNVPFPLFWSSRPGAGAKSAGNARGRPASAVAARSARPATNTSRSPSWSMSTKAAESAT